MTVLSLAVRDFRNVARAELAFSPGLNLFTGDNGAGKTSLLEALYFLGRAQSFRTAQPAQAIRSGAESLLVTGQLAAPDGGTTAVGVERSRTAARIRLAGRPVSGLAELVARFPFQVLTPDSHELLDGGPRARRRYLDWGVFHVEPSFLPTWRRFGRALQQRNAALRSHASLPELTVWDRELAVTADILDHQRATYIAELSPVLARYIAQFVEVPGLRWAYRRGWSPDMEYLAALQEGVETDRRYGFTRLGPHRADLAPLIGNRPAHERISRGQQKLIVTAMVLAQGALYQAQRGAPCLFLIDDLASELDSAHRQAVLGDLRDMGAQLFLTAIEDRLINDVEWPASRQFHVEHGRVSEVVY